jgi:two-component system, NarL family, sensor kinase
MGFMFLLRWIKRLDNFSKSCLIFTLLLIILPLYSSAQNEDSLKKVVNKLTYQIDNETDEIKKASMYKDLGSTYRKLLGYNKLSIINYHKSLEIYEKNADSTGYYEVAYLIGDFYFFDAYMRKYGLFYLNKSYQYAKKMKDTRRANYCLINIISNKLAQGIVEPSMISDLQTIYRQSNNVDSVYFRAYSYNMIANVYLRKKSIDSALVYCEKSKRWSAKSNQEIIHALNYFYSGIAYHFKYRYRDAIKQFEIAMPLVNRNKDNLFLQGINKHLATSYDSLGDYRKAYAYRYEELRLMEAFHDSEQTRGIRSQELAIQLTKSANEKNIREEKLKNAQNLITFLIISTLLVLIIVGGLIYSRKQQKLIFNQSQLIQEQKVNLLEGKLVKALLDGQEIERTRIATDLHDGMGVMLTNLKFYTVSKIKNLLEPERNHLINLIDESIAEVRYIASDLKSFSLQKFGLSVAIEDLVEKLNKSKHIEFVFEHFSNGKYAKEEDDIMIYRAIQEIINNAIKYADCQKVTIQMMENENSVAISIEDDGIGFDFEVKKETGNGIRNIKNRIEFIGGQVFWQNNFPNKGTTVMISVPSQELSA